MDRKEGHVRLLLESANSRKTAVVRFSEPITAARVYSNERVWFFNESSRNWKGRELAFPTKGGLTVEIFFPKDAVKLSVVKKYADVKKENKRVEEAFLHRRLIEAAEAVGSVALVITYFILALILFRRFGKEERIEAVPEHISYVPNEKRTLGQALAFVKRADTLLDTKEHLSSGYD